MSAITDRIRNCCDQCAHSKIRCDSKRPICLNCRRRDRPCTYSFVRQSGRPRRARTTLGAGVDSREPVERVGENTRSTTAGQHFPSPTAAAPPPSPAITAAPASRTNSICDQLQMMPGGEDPQYADQDHHTGVSGADFALEDTAMDSLDPLAMPHMEHTISADYLTSAPMETDFPMSIYNEVYNQTHDDTFISMDQFITTPAQSTPLSPPTTSSPLEQTLHDLLDDSRLRTAIDNLLNDPLTPHPHTPTPPLSTTCRCPTNLNKLYLIVMDPKLAHPPNALPLDLILFLEQALHSTVESMHMCPVCASGSLASANGIALCIVADWLASAMQTALETEINGAVPAAPARGERREAEGGDAVPLSEDERNSLRVGAWRAPGEAWTLCVSAVLAQRIRRMQGVLVAVGGGGEGGAAVKCLSTVRAKRDMARDISAKAEVLLGMVKTWVAGCYLRCQSVC